eukprot:67501-Chlamydomonas_euryale.AAC.8
MHVAPHAVVAVSADAPPPQLLLVLMPSPVAVHDAAPSAAGDADAFSAQHAGSVSGVVLPAMPVRASCLPRRLASSICRGDERLGWGVEIGCGDGTSAWLWHRGGRHTAKLRILVLRESGCGHACCGVELSASSGECVCA